MRFALEAGLLLAVAVAVIAFGGTEPVSFAAVQILLFVLLAALLMDGENPGRWQPPLLAPVFLFGYSLFQVIPLPADLFAELLRRDDPELVAGFVTVSLDRYSTMEHGLLLLACLCLFNVALVVLRERRAQRRVVLALIVLGVAEAFYRLVQFFRGGGETLSGIQGTGTYINRNHFAGLLEMIVPLAVGMAFYHSGSSHRNGETAVSEASPSPLSGAQLPKAALFLFLGVLMFVAIVFSGSRMGTLSALISLGAVIFLAVTSARRYSLGLRVFLFFLSTSLWLGTWVGLAPVRERFAGLERELALENVGRWAIWEDTVALIGQYPVFGVGLGVFDIAVTSVQSSHVNQFINYAHNDYLQLVAELGFLGTVLFFIPIFWVFMLTIRRVYQPGDRFESAMALGAAGGILALLTHSLTDGNLYIPANALVFSLLLALGYAAARQEAT